MKKILVACGTGMSTSTMIAHKLQEFLNRAFQPLPPNAV